MKNRMTKEKRHTRPVVNINDVAQHAGVSSATVSRVLAKKPHVRQEVQERVWKAIHELGYRPNRVARSLRAQKSKLIGLIISDIQNPFFTSIVRAIEDIAHQQGYSVILCNTDESPEKEKFYLDLMYDENVSGIIVCPARENTQYSLDQFVNAIPLVTLDRRLIGLDTDAILLDNVDSACRLVKHLIGNGYKRIGAVIGTSDFTTGLERYKGYRLALEQHNMPFDPELVIQVPPKTDEGYRAGLQLLKLPQRPEALIAGNNLLTLGILKAIREHGLNIPQQIAVAGFDEMPWSALVEPGITVIEQPTYELGRTAAEVLLRRMENPARPPREVVLKGRLIVRGSSQ
jgi:LacI family transcriptional regulator, fructose operon transcriptional repressor